MAKILKEERLVLILTLTRTGGTGPVAVECRADYVVGSEDLEQPRSLAIPLNASQVSTITKLGASVEAKIKQQETIST